jgi:hypothetical protein
MNTTAQQQMPAEGGEAQFMAELKKLEETAR